MRKIFVCLVTAFSMYKGRSTTFSLRVLIHRTNAMSQCRRDSAARQSFSRFCGDEKARLVAEALGFSGSIHNSKLMELSAQVATCLNDPAHVTLACSLPRFGARKLHSSDGRQMAEVRRPLLRRTPPSWTEEVMFLVRESAADSFVKTIVWLSAIPKAIRPVSLDYSIC
jgi:hypothetical protein